MSLRVRINLIMTLLIVAFSLVTAKIVLDDARRQIREEMEAGTKVTLQLLTTVLYSSQFVPPSENAPNGVLLGFLTQLGRVRANEIRMFAGDGMLLYTSPPPVYKAGRSAPQWFTHLVTPRTQQVELNVKGGRIVITPDPSRSILDAWDDMRNLIWLALLFLVLVNGVVFWLLGRALQPVGTILRGLSQMERGQLDARLPHFSLPEFDAIGQTFNRMAGALEESHAENTRLALVAKQSSDAIMIHDLEGNISFWNPAAERLFGYRPSEIVGHSAKVLTAPGLEDEVSANLETIRSRKTVENLDTKRRTRDGRVVDVALSAAPLIDPATGDVIGEICGMRDITEHRRAQQTERELEQNRRLTQLIQTRLEEERRAIARELHDELGQCVTAIKTIGAAIANRTKETSSEIHASAQTIVSVAAHIYDVVHGIIRQLRPSALDHLGLREAVEDLVNIWRSRHPEIACDLALRGRIDGLGEAINITVYRLIQECLTNILRHAKASRTQIEVRRDGGILLVSVADNGKGLGERGQSESERFGLMGMRERVQALGGEFNLESRPGVGLTVSASIPVHDSDSNGADGDQSDGDQSDRDPSGHDPSNRGDVQVIAK
jgi:two-component system, NarL family, sensor histidine kinase UhpB